MRRCALLLFGLMEHATEARAQCSFDSSVPAEGDVLAELPSQMAIKFLFEIELQNVRLLRSDGTVWSIDWTRAEGNVYGTEFRPTTPLPPGRYQIEWTGYVRQHYHPDGSVISFTVGSPTAMGESAGVKPAATLRADGVPRGAPGWPRLVPRAGAGPPADR